MKMSAEFFLAAAFDEQVKRATQGHLDTRDLLIGLTITLAVGAGLVLWIFLRSRMKSHRQDQERLAQMIRSQSGGKSSSGKSASTITADGRHRRRKRRRRRDHRQRNSTLSETGGLPPLRPEDQLPKY